MYFWGPVLPCFSLSLSLYFESGWGWGCNPHKAHLNLPLASTLVGNSTDTTDNLVHYTSTELISKGLLIEMGKKLSYWWLTGVEPTAVRYLECKGQHLNHSATVTTYEFSNWEIVKNEIHVFHFLDLKLFQNSLKY